MVRMGAGDHAPRRAADSIRVRRNGCLSENSVPEVLARSPGMVIIVAGSDWLRCVERNVLY